MAMNCGPQVLADGVNGAEYQGRRGEAVVSNLRGKYSEASQRSKLFIGSTPAAGVTIPIFSNTTQQIVLHNPVGSLVNLNLLRVTLGYVSGTMVAGHFCIGNQTLLTSAISGTAGLVQNSRLIAAGAAGQGNSGLLYTAATVTAFTYLRPMSFSQTVQAATATNTPWSWQEEIDGEITIGPGSAICIAANAAAFVIATCGLLWEEVAI